VSGAREYSVVLDARIERAPGVDGLLMKEKLGGKSLLSHSLDRFDEDERCTEVIVLAAPAVREWIAHDPLTFASGKLRLLPEEATLAAALEQAGATALAYHEAVRPNWQAALLDSLLRAWQPGGGAVPGGMLDGPLARLGHSAGDSSAPATAAQDVFGAARAAATSVHAVGELLAPAALCLIETPQVFDRDALVSAMAQAGAGASPLAAAHAAGLPLLLLPARPHNFAVRDHDALHLLRRLLGEPKKGGKDRYGGLGW
jgi:2-C-methyl-D-erythritol 4-phosphate cytidylyltransferase